MNSVLIASSSWDVARCGQSRASREHRCACSRKYDASTQIHTYDSAAFGIFGIPTGRIGFELGHAEQITERFYCDHARGLERLVRHVVGASRAANFFLFHALTELTAALVHARAAFNIVQWYQLPGQ